MIAEDYLPPLFDGYDDEYDEPVFNVTCKRCGERQLGWESNGESWFLVTEDSEPHHCAVSFDDFPDLPIG